MRDTFFDNDGFGLKFCHIFSLNLKKREKWRHDTQHHDTQFKDIQPIDTQHNFSTMRFNITMNKMRH